MSRSWSSAHDWKSCIPQKGIESSNLSISAKTEPALIFELFYRESRLVFCLKPCKSRLLEKSLSGLKSENAQKVKMKKF